MWTHPCILTNLSHPEAHMLLSRTKFTYIGETRKLLNGYEYGLFGSASTCVLLAKTMQLQGRVFDNMIRSSVVDIAKKHGKEDNIRIMKVMYWDLDIIRAILRRSDARKILNKGEYNAYEMALAEDPVLSKEVGSVIRNNNFRVSDVIKHNVFVTSPASNIKALFDM